MATDRAAEHTPESDFSLAWLAMRSRHANRQRISPPVPDDRDRPGPAPGGDPQRGASLVIATA